MHNLCRNNWNENRRWSQYQEFGNRLWLAHGTLFFCLHVTFSAKHFVTSSHATSYVTHNNSQDHVILPFSNSFLKLWLPWLLKHVILKLFPPVFCYLFQFIHSLGQAPPFVWLPLHLCVFKSSRILISYPCHTWDDNRIKLKRKVRYKNG